MAFKSDVKPVICAANLTTLVLFTGPTRLRGYMVQNGTGIVDGIGVVSNTSLTVTLFIEK